MRRQYDDPAEMGPIVLASRDEWRTALLRRSAER
jgi:hypothetical protein